MDDWLLEAKVAPTRGCKCNFQISQFVFFWDIVSKWRLLRFSSFFFLHQHSPQCWCIEQLDCEVHPCWQEDPRKGCLKTKSYSRACMATVGWRLRMFNVAFTNCAMYCLIPSSSPCTTLCNGVDVTTIGLQLRNLAKKPCT